MSVIEFVGRSALRFWKLVARCAADLWHPPIGVPMARYDRPERRIDRILDDAMGSRGVTGWSAAAILVVGAPLAYVVAAEQAGATFDAASVKPAVPPAGVTILPGGGMLSRGVRIPRDTGGPGTSDPGRIHYPLISLKNLLGRAFDSYFEVKGPDWMSTDLIQVDATMPTTTTKEQFREMLATLLVDRFKLKYHIESKAAAGYELVVAKRGIKMKESVDVSTPATEDDGEPVRSGPRQMGPDGFSIVPPVKGPALRFLGEMGDRARMLGQQQTMHDLARALGRMLKSVVADSTGLTTKYDFTLTYAGTLAGPRLGPEPSPDADTLPDIFSALQEQLGLKLEPKKVTVEVMVIDRIEKLPVEN